MRYSNEDWLIYHISFLTSTESVRLIIWPSKIYIWNTYCCMFLTESNKVILFSYDINSNIISLTEYIELNSLNMWCLKITIYFSYFLKSVCNVLQGLWLWWDRKCPRNWVVLQLLKPPPGDNIWSPYVPPKELNFILFSFCVVENSIPTHTASSFVSLNTVTFQRDVPV